ncbi:hypothetical protein DL767_009498 [Monosporascus sp. MG133]|nr:hypothetical protein DL767_009498 [Monosporascus sp. MG133]
MHAVDFAMVQYYAEKHGWTKFVSMQNNYNLLSRDEDREIIRFCNKTGGSPPLAARVNPRRRVMFQSRVPSFVINNSVTSPLVGASCLRRISDTLTSKGTELADEEGTYLEESYRPEVGYTEFLFLRLSLFGTLFEVKNTVLNLSKITIRSGNRVDALSCVDADGPSSGSYGGTGGQEFEFELEPDETITTVNQEVEGVQFSTNKGRASWKYGGLSLEDEADLPGY